MDHTPRGLFAMVQAGQRDLLAEPHLEVPGGDRGRHAVIVGAAGNGTDSRSALWSVRVGSTVAEVIVVLTLECGS